MQKKELNRLKKLLDQQVERFNNPDFIKQDPISIPHQFAKLQDIEIAAFFAAIFAWGNRKAIINKTSYLMSLMDNQPFDFILHFKQSDLKPFESFVYRTFNYTDLEYTLYFFKEHYTQYHSLEDAFLQFDKEQAYHAELALNGFYHYFFSLGTAYDRTRKHIACPEKKSACKRLNLLLRWMVRKDDAGVDFGLWSRIPEAELICPLDVHSGRVARSLGLLKRKQNDWKAAVELSNNLKIMDPDDPVVYDYALFGMGVNNINDRT